MPKHPLAANATPLPEDHPPIFLRSRVEGAIAALIDLVDSLDPDPDLEPDNDDEPSLGWCDGKCEGRYGDTDEREADAGDECEIDADQEPSLGWITRDTGAIVHGACSDLEEERR